MAPTPALALPRTLILRQRAVEDPPPRQFCLHWGFAAKLWWCPHPGCANPDRDARSVPAHEQHALLAPYPPPLGPAARCSPSAVAAAPPRCASASSPSALPPQWEVAVAAASMLAGCLASVALRHCAVQHAQHATHERARRCAQHASAAGYRRTLARAARAAHPRLVAVAAAAGDQTAAAVAQGCGARIQH